VNHVIQSSVAEGTYRLSISKNLCCYLLQGLRSHLFGENCLSQSATAVEKVTLNFAKVTLSYSILCSSFLFYLCTIITYKSYSVVIWGILEPISHPYFGEVLLHCLPDKIKSSASTDSACVKQQLVIKGWHERQSQQHDGMNVRNDCDSTGQKEFGMIHCQM